MITRTVRAENMLTALEVIKKELGPDAMVVSVRQIMSGPSWQVWRKPLIEVVAVRLVDGEPREQLKAAIAHHKTMNSQESGTDSQESTDKSLIDFQPEPVEKMLNKQPQADQGKKPSAYLRKYQTNVVEDSEEETDDPGEVSQKINPRPLEIEQSNISRKKEISKPIFERITTDFKNKKYSNLEDQEEQTSLLNLSEQVRGPMPSDLAEVLDLPPMVLKTYQYLLRHGLDETLLQKVTHSCADSLPPRAVQEKKRVWEYIQKQLVSVVRIQKETISTLPRVIFLVGTSGVGKTSTIAKLAVHLRTNEGRKVGWICADTVRIGAIGEARTYTETIGTPLQVVYTADELQSAIDLFSNEVEFILVDTSAYNPRNEQSIVELGEKLTAYSRRCTWVVIPATAKENDIHNALATISSFKPKGLVMTKFDETNNFSAVYNIAWRSQLPLTYFTFGSRVINDLIPANADLLVRAIFDERFMP
jgi:flagellar biosynthesis protein FlhF